MIHYGVIFFMLEKLGAVVGVSNLLELEVESVDRGDRAEPLDEPAQPDRGLHLVHYPQRCLPLLEH